MTLTMGNYAEISYIQHT